MSTITPSEIAKWSNAELILEAARLELADWTTAVDAAIVYRSMVNEAVLARRLERHVAEKVATWREQAAAQAAGLELAHKLAQDGEEAREQAQELAEEARRIFAALACAAPSEAALDEVRALPRERLKELTLDATDALYGAQARLGRQEITYSEAQAAAYRLLHLRREGERRFHGRPRLKVDVVSAARLLRG